MVVIVVVCVVILAAKEVVEIRIISVSCFPLCFANISADIFIRV